MLKGDELKRQLMRRGLFVRTPINSRLKELEPEIALGRAILDRALIDSFDSSSDRAWFNLDNDDFINICFISFLEPERVMDQFTVVTTKITQVSGLASVVPPRN